MERPRAQASRASEGRAGEDRAVATPKARKTLVSLSTPRRVFAVVQPTTKTRVDLGLRLDRERPGGGPLAARDLDATVRISLLRPGMSMALTWMAGTADAKPGQSAGRVADPGRQ